jgi:CBS domain-containing protein
MLIACNNAYMIVEDIIDFLKKVPPFQFLDNFTLRDIATSLSMEFYPKGAVILQQGGQPSDTLRIIKKGAVKVFIKTGNEEEMLIDYRSEGDAFGLLSMVGGDKSRANVVAEEDTICYLLDRENVNKLIKSNPAFTEFFLKSFFDKYIDKSLKEVHGRSLLFSSSEDKLLFSTPVGELATRKIITAARDISIKEAAEIMSQGRISSLVLVDENNVPSGIVTDRDLRDKVVAKARDVSGPVSDIMSLSMIKIEGRDYCFEALLKMIRFNIHHLLVVEEGDLKGIITNHDLMMLQGTSPISIAREIESRVTIDGLVPVSKKITNIIGILLKEGAKASNITRIITEVNDRLVQKILGIIEKNLGHPPVNYCWIAFGSEGRKEQTFKTDQDNALIYDDSGTPQDEEKASKYFSEFTLQARDALIRCGFSVCPANYMASNPQWRRPLRTWKKYFSNWISEPVADSVLKSLIFFDFRPIYGDFSLSEELRDHLNSTLQDHMIFLGFMANMIIKNRPPIGFFKTFVVEKSGEHKDKLNLKVKGLAPIIDIVRFFGLEKGIRNTPTIERLKSLKDKHTIVQEYGDELEHAFEFIMLLRIHHQYEQIESGADPDNFIDPNRLSNLEKKTIREAFHLISIMQDLIIERYKNMIM